MKNVANSGKWPGSTNGRERTVTTYQVWTSPEQQKAYTESPPNPQMQEDWFTFKIIEEACRNSKYIDYTILDDLESDSTPKAFYLKNYLKSIEKLAVHWKLVQKEDYEYRIKTYDNIDKFINEIPRATNGRYFSIKTFLLS